MALHIIRGLHVVETMFCCGFDCLRGDLQRDEELSHWFDSVLGVQSITACTLTNPLEPRNEAQRGDC